MAGKSAVVSVLITGDAKKLKDAFGEGEKASGGFASKLGGAKTAMLGVAGVAAGGAAVLFSWAQGAAEDEKAATALAKTAQNSAGATKEQTDALEDFITAQGKAFGVADDQLRPALDSLIRGTGDLSKAQKLSSLAMDISAATGKDLTSVSDALSKAYNGQLGPLKKLDPALGDLIKSGASTDEVFGALSETFSGQAAASADTAAGKWQIAKLQLSELQEEIGYKLLPVLAALATFLVEKVIPAMEDLAAWVEVNWPKVRDVIVPIMEKIQEVIERVWPAIKQIIEGVMLQIKGIIEVITGLIHGDWGMVWEGLKHIFEGIWLEITGKIKLAFEGLKLLLGGLASDAKNAVTTKFDELVGFFTGLPGRLAGAATNMFGFLTDQFKAAINSLIGLWNSFKVPEVKVGGQDPLGPFGPSIPEVTLGGWKFPQIPYLAEGGTARGAGWSVVGDEGPELLHMPRGASVVPLGAGGGVTFVNQGIITTTDAQRWFERNLAQLAKNGSPALAGINA